ncbi:hypothetical protein J2T09_000101 [Neorhizobium huautlense]|uniref:Uncharacterized protein n=1 Tax=Neorhizobium huautlense TaxID=67774 RepID=A0ABT9PLL4_9HYPH|nr:hypothetical protein [Neorhizobium huautlense]MDP9835360.1 hypothetical protein [Neorhizobium huautlense]
MASTATADPSEDTARGPIWVSIASVAAAVLGVHAGQIIPPSPPLPENTWETFGQVVFNWQSFFWFLSASVFIVGFQWLAAGPTHETPAQYFRWHFARLRAGDRIPAGAIIIVAALTFPIWAILGLAATGALFLGFLLIFTKPLLLNIGIAGRISLVVLWFATGWIGSDYFSEAKDVSLPCKPDAQIKLTSGEMLTCETVDAFQHYKILLFHTPNESIYLPVTSIDETSFVAATQERAILLFPLR